jgi:hypothetical protein
MQKGRISLSQAIAGQTDIEDYIERSKRADAMPRGDLVAQISIHTAKERARRQRKNAADEGIVVAGRKAFEATAIHCLARVATARLQ